MTKITLDTGQVVYDPTGRVEALEQPTAARAEQLRGLRLGVLDNSKWNGGALLRETVALLSQAEGPFESITTYVKPSFSKVAEPELIDRIAADSDVVVTAIGD
jgi:hypothetical protein